ncbi:MAG: SAM-dependent methyltransferase [Rhodoferax sp.]|nr:SAM-dependent methyltransferase [Rhodoferax sp.]
MHPKAVLDECTELVRQVLRFEHPADAVVSRFFRENRSLGPRERATLAETVYTLLRNKLLFDHLAPSGSGPKERRMAILAFAHSEDDSSSRGGAGNKQGARDFLAGALNDQEKHWLAQCDQVQSHDLMERHRHNLPEWLVQPLREQLKDEFWQLVESLNRSAGIDLRVNTMTSKRAEVQAELAKAGVNAKPTKYSPNGLRLADKPNLAKVEAFNRGAIEVQDEGSQLLALLLDAKRGEMVVDFCAGAGGKTLAIGAGMRSTGRLYAFDTSAHRLESLKPRLARSGLSNVHPVAIAHERDDRIKRLAGKMDRVLVDAPCSGLGTLRRNPDLKWRQSPTTVAEYAALQTTILQSAARLLKPGGRLVYATCSVLPQENEAIAQAFTAANQGFTPLETVDILTHLKVDHAASLCAGPVTGGEFLRLWPHRHGTDGFFAAVWQKQ